MNTYLLMQTEDGVELNNKSCYYPTEFEKKVNILAGETITCRGPSISFMPNFHNSFCIQQEKWNVFVEKVLPYIGSKLEHNNNVVWDKDEEEIFI